MADSKLLFSNTFAGTGYPTWDAWPSFVRVTGNPAFSGPVVDGTNHGICDRYINLGYRMKESRSAGSPSYQVEVTGQWSNPAGSQREAGIMVRFKDYNNFLVARLRSKVGTATELRLFRVINGTETQLGSTYSGAPISSSVLYTGCTWRISVEDLDDGDTKIEVYTEPNGTSDRGDARISYTGDVYSLRGNYGCGIEIGDNCKGTDIIFSDFNVYDLSDTVVDAPAPAPGTGWLVKLGDDIYTLAQLEALDPPVELINVGQQIGLSGGSDPTFSVKGSFNEGIIRPGLPVEILHDGDTRFIGRMTSGRRTASPDETQLWTAKSFIWGALQVLLEEDDGTASIYFNVSDSANDYYSADRQQMTLGDILEWLFDRYLDKLRFYGAVPASGDAYTASQLTPLDAIIPDISVSGNFLAAVQAILKYMPTYEVFGNPESKKWEFVDTTDTVEDDVVLTSEHATLTVEPDPESCYTAVLFRGAKKGAGDPISLSMADKAWTQGQQSNWEKNQAYKSHITADILSAGNYSLPLPAGVPKGCSSWVEIPVSAGMTEDAFRGAVAMISGRSQTYWVLGNTGTRIYLNILFNDIPHDGTITLNLVHPDAVQGLSAAGVGSAYFLGIAQIDGCGGGGYASGLKNGGWCGTASVSSRGDDGSTSTQKYAYHVSLLSADQSEAFGQCAILSTSEPVKPSIGLINRLPPSGSVAPQWCEPGGYTPDTSVQIDVSVPTHGEEAPRLRYPEEGFSGEAYDSWQQERELVIDMPDFTDDSQATGLQAAAEAMHALYSQKQYLFNIDLATVWNDGANTSRFANPGTKSVTISSSKRTTGFENIALPVHSVMWGIKTNKTSLAAGSLAGWLNIDPLSMSRQFTERDVMKRIGQSLKQLEDFRNRFLEKTSDVVTASRGGDISGCEVVVTDENTRTIKNVTEDDEDKKGAINWLALQARATESLFDGPDQSFPGAKTPVPGFEDDQVQDDGTLGPIADPRIPFMGVPDRPNANISKYGGVLGADEVEAGDMPHDFYRKGGLAFRRKPNIYDTSAGGVGMQFSPLDTDGNPTTWSDYTSPRDLPGGRAPIYGMLGLGSTQHQLLGRTDAISQALGKVQGDVDELLAAGETSTEYPDGAPAGVADYPFVSGLNGHMRVVPESINDPAGPVWSGPISDSGADAEMLWRVEPNTKLLVQIEEVAAGAGVNGGRYQFKDQGNGAYFYMSSHNLVHKQVHTSEMSESSTTPGTTACTVPDNPWGAPEGVTLNYDGAGAPSTVAAVVTAPPGSVGRPSFWAVVQEDSAGLAVGAGLEYDLKVEYSYKMSPWSGAQTATTGSLTSSGSNDAIGGPFRGPGDAVPPGLRSPFGISMATTYTPGGSTPTGASLGVLSMGVEIFTIEGGYLLLLTENPIGAADEVVHNNPWAHEVVGMGDSYSLEFEKNIAEAVTVGDYAAVELNP